MPSIQLGKVELFLLGALGPAACARYLGAFARFSSELDSFGLVWSGLSDASQDTLIAEQMVDLAKEGKGIAVGAALVALSKIQPRSDFRFSWRVLDVWKRKLSPRQVSALPGGTCMALASLAVTFELPQIGTNIVLCCCGCLRVSGVVPSTFEDLHFSGAVPSTFEDLHFVGSTAVLVLGQTKVGIEKKAVLSSLATIDLLLRALLRREERSLYRCRAYNALPRPMHIGPPLPCCTCGRTAEQAALVACHYCNHNSCYDCSWNCRSPACGCHDDSDTEDHEGLGRFVSALIEQQPD
jgi:hypothetical protein